MKKKMYPNLPMNTTTFQTKNISKAYTSPLRIFLPTITTFFIPRQGFDNGQIGWGHLRHDWLVEKKWWMVMFCGCLMFLIIEFFSTNILKADKKIGWFKMEKRIEHNSLLIEGENTLHTTLVGRGYKCMQWVLCSIFKFDQYFVTENAIQKMTDEKSQSQVYEKNRWFLFSRIPLVNHIAYLLLLLNLYLVVYLVPCTN